ncbi:MAG: hemin receptor [Flavisolibacter sp.]
MKKTILLLSAIYSFFNATAQEPSDALRYSWYVPGGTARVQAIGGAMGSLGGDLTATFVNPAGLGFYKTGDFVLSPNFSYGNTKAKYLNTTQKDHSEKFTWGASGIVLGSGSNSEQKSSAFSIAYNRTADFNTNIQYKGVNNQSSYSQKFLEEIQNNNIKDPNQVASGFPFGTSLAFNTFWIDTVGTNLSQFQTRATIATGLMQQNKIRATGGIDELAIGYAVNKNDKFYLGGSIGVPFLHYKRDQLYSEKDISGNPNNNFESALIEEHLQTTGVGLNLKIGMIYKIQDLLRIGLALHSPSVYQLTDTYGASVTTNTEFYKGTQTQSSDAISSAVTNFKYLLVNPYRIIGSLSYVIRETEDVTQQRGFITGDVEYINYKSSSFKPDQNNNNDQTTIDYLKSLSGAVKKAYKGSFNFRVGGELKFTTFMVRAGVAYYGNPYKNINGEKGNKLNLSCGLGYRNKGFFVDLTYVHHLNQDVSYPYRLQNAPYFGANTKSSIGNTLLTFGFKI